VLAFPLRNGAQLVGEIRKQHGAKCCIAGDQVADGLFHQLVRHHFFGRRKSAGDPFGDQSSAVEAIIDAVGIDHLAALVLMDDALDDDEEMAWLDPHVQDRLAGTKVRDVHAVANQSLFVRIETVKGRCGKVEGIGHGRGVSVAGFAGSHYRVFAMIRCDSRQ